MHLEMYMYASLVLEKYSKEGPNALSFSSISSKTQTQGAHIIFCKSDPPLERERGTIQFCVLFLGISIHFKVP